MFLMPSYIEIAHSGYIAGSGDGIVTVQGMPAARHIYLLDAVTMQLLSRNQSLPSGHYIFIGLDLNRHYLVMVRDYKKEYEPSCFDNVKPADDLTVSEQQELRQTWQ